jgi:hypothetical protein
MKCGPTEKKKKIHRNSIEFVHRKLAHEPKQFYGAAYNSGESIWCSIETMWLDTQIFCREILWIFPKENLKFYKLIYLYSFSSALCFDSKTLLGDTF